MAQVIHFANGVMKFGEKFEDASELFKKTSNPVAEKKEQVEEKALESKVDFDSMSVSELKAYAKEHEIDIKGLSYKDEILAAVKSASAE